MTQDEGLTNCSRNCVGCFSKVVVEGLESGMAWTSVRRCVRLLACSCSGWRHRSSCLLVLKFLLLVGIVNLAWLSLSAPHGRADTQPPERVIVDGGIKLTFGNREPHVGRKVQEPSLPDNICEGNGPCLPSDKMSAPGRALNKSEEKADADTIGKIQEATRTEQRSVERRKPLWCSGRSNNTLPPGAGNFMVGKKYFLTAVLLVRIYDYDLAKLTTREMIQWLQYLSYAGVEHVYVYDAYLYRNESQREKLDCFVQTGFVTYVDWSHRAKPKYSISGTQVSAYQNCLNQFGADSVWQTAIDIDEYPFCPGDHSQGFLSRAVWKMSRDSSIGEISMENFLFLGKPLDSTQHPLLIDRLWRRTFKKANPLVKPIYQPKAVFAASVHHNSLRTSYSNHLALAEVLRMNHYWGARLQNWGEDTPKTLSMTMEDRGMTEAVSALQPCLQDCNQGCCS